MHWRPARDFVVNVENSAKDLIAMELGQKRTLVSALSSMMGAKMLLCFVFHESEKRCKPP